MPSPNAPSWNPGHKLIFPENTLTAILDFGELYFPGLAAPGGAIKLLEHLVNLKLNHSPAATNGERLPPESEMEIQHEDVVQTLESFTGIPGLVVGRFAAVKASRSPAVF